MALNVAALESVVLSYIVQAGLDLGDADHAADLGAATRMAEEAVEHHLQTFRPWKYYNMRLTFECQQVYLSYYL